MDTRPESSGRVPLKMLHLERGSKDCRKRKGVQYVAITHGAGIRGGHVPNMGVQNLSVEGKGLLLTQEKKTS